MQEENNSREKKPSSEKISQDDQSETGVEGNLDLQGESKTKEQKEKADKPNGKIDVKTKDMPGHRKSATGKKKNDEKNDSPDKEEDKKNHEDKINVKGEIPSRITASKSDGETPSLQKEKKEEQEKTPTEPQTNIEINRDGKNE